MRRSLRLMRIPGILALFSLAQGAVLFQEDFENTAFSSRGWYDSPQATLSTQNHVSGGSCFECFFKTGSQKCAGGTPGRHLFTESESVYLSFWVKYSANYVGSGKPYHPHLFHFVTNKDNQWVGPSFTHLTTYTEQVGGVVRIALQDGLNNDTNCILLNNNSFVRCNGNYSTYKFTEARSVCSCNGFSGDLDGRDCFNQGDGTYYSARYWDSPDTMFKNSPGRFYKGDWHFIGCYFQMNSVSGGIGVPDGIIRYWYDDSLIMDYSHILFRTGVNPDMRFNQFLIAPYIGDGSPVDQYLWIDDLAVSTSRPTALDGRGPLFPGGGRAIIDVMVNNAPPCAFGVAAFKPFTLELANVRGQVIWHSRFNAGSGHSSVRIPAQAGSGLYFATVRQQGNIESRKVVLLR